MRVRVDRRALFVCLFSASILTLSSPVIDCHAAEVTAESETILRVFEGGRENTNEQRAAPIYEYLKLGVDKLPVEGLSFQAHAWGRYDLESEYEEERSAGEVLSAYLQYYVPSYNFLWRLGRQQIFAGISNESIDGARAGLDLTRYFAVDAYAGQPVSLETTNGRNGDSIFGGRFSHHLRGYYDVGLSYKRLLNDGDTQEQVMGIDSRLSLPLGIIVSGLSSLNIETDGWREHSYEARIPILRFELRPFFERFQYDDFFEAGLDNSQVFRFLANTGEVLTVIGGELAWAPFPRLDLSAQVKHYDYDEQDETSVYYAGKATWRWKGLSQIGAELGRMDGDTPENRYTLSRGYLYWDWAPMFASADLMYVWYDEPINSEQDAWFSSIGVGSRFLKDTLELKASGDYSADPFFDSDLRGMFTLRYLFQL